MLGPGNELAAKLAIHAYPGTSPPISKDALISWKVDCKSEAESLFQMHGLGLKKVQVTYLSTFLRDN